MKRFFQRVLIACAVCLACGVSSEVRANPPASLGYGRTLEPGITVYGVTLPHDGIQSHAWIYLPNRKPGIRLPCIFIAPAGTPLIYGMALGQGDVPEHLPYVRAGYAVVAYDLDGNVLQNHTSRDFGNAVVAFMRSDAGLKDAEAAINYTLKTLPFVDPHRLYSAGHSSAGTMSLLLAEHDARIKACIAYAPVCYVPQQVGPKIISVFSGILPDYAQFLVRSSPSTNVHTLHCPLFLFHADDDANVPTSDNISFARLVTQTNHHVTFVRVATGNHYQSMINPGIPTAILWLRRVQTAHR